jgi:hypothetical protein
LKSPRRHSREAYGFAGRTTAAQDRRSLLLTRWSDADRR